MKEYILNETPIKTTNGFKMNNIHLNLDMNGNYDFKDIEIINGDKIQIRVNKNGNSITSKIGLEFEKSYVLDIIVPQNIKIENPIYLTYSFSNDDIIINDLHITYEENSEANFIIKYQSIDIEKHINFLKEKIIASTSSKGSITIVNLLNENSYNFIAIEGNVLSEALLRHNIIDLGACISVSNVDINLNDYKANHYLNSLYLGKNNDIIDISYYIKNKGQESTNMINTKGVLFDNSRKNFKGIIDFNEGSKKSIGKEQENCLLLSENCLSRSLPMLLCHEEDVDGAHGVSSGKIDEDKLFYLMSRGLSEIEAKKLIIKANFSEIIKEIVDSDLQNQLYQFIDNII